MPKKKVIEVRKMAKGDAKKLVKELMIKPKKESKINTPHTYVPQAGQVVQADLVFLPHDEVNGKTYKYALVVVDLGNGATDAEPLINKGPKHVLDAFETIFNRNYVDEPESRIEMDPGTEFKGVVKKHFIDKGLVVKVGKTGRHRQQATVESRNGVIGRKIFGIQYEKEFEEGEENREWVKELPTIIKDYNSKIKDKKKYDKDIPLPRAEGDAQNLLDYGTKVRVILDEPKSTFGNKLHGKFRNTDLRWENKERTIQDVFLRPAQPPTYRVSEIPGVAYTKGQLQVVKQSK